MSDEDQDFEPEFDESDEDQEFNLKEDAGDDDSEQDYDPKVKSKAKGKGKGKAAPKSKAKPKPKAEPKPKKPKAEPKPKAETKEKSKRAKKKESESEEEKIEEKVEDSKQEKEDDIHDGPVSYFYPTYTQAHKEEFKAKFVKLIDSIHGAEIDKDRRAEIKDLVFKYEMHKRPQALKEIFAIVRDHFTHGGKSAGDKIELLTLMSELYETLLEQVVQPKHLIEETMFFPSRESEIRLANILSRAEKTLEIWVFAFTNNTLAAAVLGRHKAGVKVRIITDDECSNFFGADIWGLVLEGVEVTMDESKKFHMHNKFAIIDDLVLATGSFNWTSQAVTGNQENLCVIDNENFIKDYKAEFEKLWIQFKPNLITKKKAQEHLEEEDLEKKRRAAKGQETKKKNREAKLLAKEIEQIEED